jgi:hypothetical protein
MKYVKMLGLLAVAAAALMAFAGSASATSITSSAGNTPTIEASAGTTELHAGDSKSFLTVVCHTSNVKGTVTSLHTATPQSGPISTLDFGGCTQTVTVLQNGSLSVTGTSTTGNGTLTSSGAEIRIHTSAGPVCTFKTNNTHIGTLTKGTHGVLDIQSALIPASGFLCPSNGVWTGSYTVNQPTNLEIH